MRFEQLESFFGQLVLHKGHCKGDITENISAKNRNFYGYSCDKCSTHWEIDPFSIYASAFRYIRGGHRQQFQRFLKEIDCSIHPQSTYEDLFSVFLVMQS